MCFQSQFLSLRYFIFHFNFYLSFSQRSLFYHNEPFPSEPVLQNFPNVSISCWTVDPLTIDFQRFRGFLIIFGVLSQYRLCLLTEGVQSSRTPDVIWTLVYRRVLMVPKWFLRAAERVGSCRSEFVCLSSIRFSWVHEQSGSERPGVSPARTRTSRQDESPDFHTHTCTPDEDVHAHCAKKTTTKVKRIDKLFSPISHCSQICPGTTK